MSTPTIKQAKDTVSGALKMVLYGNSGCGKTVTASTAPKPIYLSAEAGLLSIADKAVDVVEIDIWEDLESAFTWLKTAKHDYQTVVVDSLTEIQKKHQDHLLNTSGKDVMSQTLWAQNIEKMRKVCRAFRDLPMNVILIALAAETSPEDGGPAMKRIALQGKSLPNEVMGFVDLVGCMVAQDVKNESGETVVKRAIRFQPSETMAAKDRSGKLDTWELPDATGYFDVSAIIAKVFGSPIKSVKKEASA